MISFHFEWFSNFLAAIRCLWHDALMGRIRHIFLGALLLLLMLSAARADWQVVNWDGQDFVTLKSFCQFYKMNYGDVLHADSFHAQNSRIDVFFRRGSRELMINGVRYWLSFGILQHDDDWLISRMDLVKLIEPVLRPNFVSDKKPVKGVVIDPGHGGADHGAENSRGNEKDYTLDTAFRLERYLKAEGVKVVMTRRNDVFVDLYERARFTSLYPDYIFVSLHFNSADPDAHGLETYCCSPRGAGSTQAGGTVMRADFQKLPGNYYDIPNVLLANEVHRQIVKLNPGDSEADRGVKRARFVVLKANAAPSILVEGGFISNRSEAARIDTSAYRQKLAEAVGRGVLAYRSLMQPELEQPIGPVAPPPKPAPVVVTNKVEKTPSVTTDSISTNAVPVLKADKETIRSPEPPPKPSSVSTNEAEPPVIIYSEPEVSTNQVKSVEPSSSKPKTAPKTEEPEVVP